MVAKRKRAPGGGRKPKGDFAGLTSPVCIRMPPALRAQLKTAARRSGRSISQEVLSRLDGSLNRERDKATDRPMRAICFLISSLAYSVHWNMPNWRSDPFLFRAIRIGIDKLLDALEPAGEMKLPEFWKTYANSLNDALFKEHEILAKVQDAMRKTIIPATTSPEGMADYAVWSTLQHYNAPRPPSDSETLRRFVSKEIVDNVRKHQENLNYGMADARKDLRMRGERP
jgi:hypothetical protein